MLDKFFHDVFDSNFGGILIFDNDLKIKHMNKASENIIGFSEKEAIGKYCYEILRAKCCKDDCLIDTLKKGNKSGEYTVDIITKDNKRKYIKTKIIKSKGFWVEIFFDITREIELEKKIKEKYIFEDIITKDKHLIDILKEFPKIAVSNVPILLEGESGVGKEVFANSIQRLSQRKTKPFVKINCAALPETLLESELFGYKKGAFTDAHKNKPGHFQLAHQGTLFLDEIAEMSLSLQAKLLRVVETGEIIPLGGTQPEKADVRILTATNKKILSEVQEGNFREDLYYRLNVVSIKIPPLRERKNDIPLFIDYFIDHFNTIQKKQINGISDEVLEKLMNHTYPGNIRELRNIMEHAFIFCKMGLIQIQHLPEYLRGKTEEIPERSDGSCNESERILNALKEAQWNRNKAAEILNIDRTTLWRKMKKYKIQ